MTTPIYDIARIAQAAQRLRDGAVLAYPTEAVFGLGADPFDEAAVNRIYALKRRDPALGFLLIAANWDQVARFVDTPRLPADKLAEAMQSWPGPSTWIFPRSAEAPAWLVGAHSGIALRVTAHEPAAALCRAFGGALVSTSANRHGSPPARSVDDLRQQFGDELDGIVDAPLGSLGQPTSIRDLLSGGVLRG